MEEFRKGLLAWYPKHCRQGLPWRKTTDPYAIWVSEAMLQQTQVATVTPYYERFLKRFPTVRALSKAPLTKVLDCWSGLGYYSRAKNLRAGAAFVVRECGGKIPDGIGLLQRIPGIGRYTAGAIASIAFDRPEPALDGNGTRVLSRYLGIREDPRPTAIQRHLRDVLRRLVAVGTPGRLNQAVMDLGATVCTPRSPRCEACPVRSGCAARRLGLQEQIPPPREPLARRKIRYACGLLERSGEILLARRPMTTTLLPGLWEFPGGEVRTGESAGRALARNLAARLGIRAGPVGIAGRVRQLLTHRELHLVALRCRWKGPPHSRAPACRQAGAGNGLQRRWYADLRWVPVHRLPRMAMTAGMQKLAEVLYTK